MENKLYFRNDYLRMEQVSDTDFQYTFLGITYKVFCFHNDTMRSEFEEIKQKRISAYNLVPKGCKIIPERFIHLYDGLLIGGVLQDSIRIVYGIGEYDGIKGYACSVYFLPNEKVLNELTNYKAVSGEFKIKEQNY